MDVLHLPLRPLARREGIAPSEVVPVVDVIRDRDHVRIAAQVTQQRVGGRAARAALRREELHDDSEKQGGDHQLSLRAKRKKGFHHRDAEDTAPSLDLSVPLLQTLASREEACSKPPEAAPTVAGGASAASDHRYSNAVRVSTP